MQKYKFFDMVFFIMMAFIFTALIFFQRTVDLPYLKEIAPIACYLLPCLLLLHLWQHFIGKIKVPASLGHLRLACLFALLLQIFITYHIWFYVGFDVGIVRISAQYFVQGQVYPYAPTYFATNPNNIGIYFITVLFLQLGKVLSIDGYYLLILFGILCSNIALYLTCRCVLLLTDSRAIVSGTFLLGLLLFGLSPWIFVPYSDILSLPLPILTFYLYLQMKRKDTMSLWVKVFLICMPAIFGRLLKPTNLIILIALVILFVLDLLRGQFQHGLKKTIVVLCTFAALFALSALASKGMQSYLAISPDKSVEKSFAHYAMMGLNEKTIGNYSKTDDRLSTSIYNYSAKKDANLTLLKKRLQDMGLSGYLYHVLRKTVCNFSNGTFGWGKEGADFDEYIPQRSDEISQFLENFYYMKNTDADYVIGTGGKYFTYYVQLVQIVWICTLLLCFYHAFLLLKRPSTSEECLIHLTLLGIFAMVTLFETNARYLISYLPFFILCATTSKYQKPLCVGSRN